MQKLMMLLRELVLISTWILVILRLKITKMESQSGNIMLIPGDANTLIGSRGDEAMGVVTIQELKKQHPESKIYAACSSYLAVEKAKSMDLMSFCVWGGVKVMPFNFYASIKEIKPSFGVLMGADIMDGYYSPIDSLRMIVAADLLARSGANTFFLGFSFNENPYWILKYAFRLMHRAVKVSLRDPISLVRYVEFTHLKANLVADSAFLLTPNTQTTIVNAAKDWIASEQSGGRTVLAINFHPLLFPRATAQQEVLALSESIKTMMETLTAKHKLSWLLLPHDDRTDIGDEAPLVHLYDSLSHEIQHQAFLITNTPSAAELKAISGEVNGVITGRMHHAIATLGMGVPVMSYVYQGKFEGLFHHFKLPPWLLFTPTEAKKSEFLEAKVEKFIENIQQLKDTVNVNLPKVEALAANTFDSIN
jgi:colanic acid/amylovoran biosynthesis protein